MSSSSAWPVMRPRSISISEGSSEPALSAAAGFGCFRGWSDTGQGASRTMCSATEPSKTWLRAGAAVGRDHDHADPWSIA